MKQCPNPNCVFYTRLEELPDAYIKCPGCGGPLVAPGTMPGKRAVDTQSGAAGGEGEPPPYSDQQFLTTGNLPPQTGWETGAAQSAQMPQDRFAGPYPFAAESAPAQQVQPGPDPVGYVEAPSRWSPARRMYIVAGALFLLLACGLSAWLLSENLFPRSKFVGGAEATETALSSIRPAVNTPILPPPTITLAPLPELSPSAVAVLPPTEMPTPEPPTQAPPLPTVAPPTLAPALPTAPPPTATSVIAPVPPTSVPPTPAPPTGVVVLPTPVPPTPVPQQQAPGPTAPPPQTRPVGGIVSAGMSRSLAGGEAPGVVSEYSASEPFHLTVQARFGPGGVTSMLTRWYGPDGTQIYQMRQTYSRAGTYYAGFTLRKNGPWVPGSYRVDLYTNESPTPGYSVSFRVAP